MERQIEVREVLDRHGAGSLRRASFLATNSSHAGSPLPPSWIQQSLILVIVRHMIPCLLRLS